MTHISKHFFLVSTKNVSLLAKMNRFPEEGRKNVKFSRPAANNCWPLFCGHSLASHGTIIIGGVMDGALALNECQAYF